MSRDILRTLHHGHAFDAAPLRTQMHDLHVPFDEMTGRRTCEAPLLEAVRAGGRVALVGVSGSGKTSVTAHVLGPMVEGLAPIPVPVYIERPEVATDPGAFAAHVVGLVRRWVYDGLPGRASTAEAVMPRRGPASQRFTIAPQWLGAKVELGYELRQVTEEHRTTSVEVLAQAQHLLEVVADAGLTPVLLLDDTDRWLNLDYDRDSLTRRAAFFGRVVRVVAEELPTAAVVAVHPTYLTDEHYQSATGFLDTSIRIPLVPTPAGVRRVLARRAALALRAAEDGVLDGVVEPAAFDLLFTAYQPSGDLRRRVLQVAHEALAVAVDDGARRLEERHIRSALAEEGPA